MTEKLPIFQATYSGVEVYEMLCRGIAVMRRKTDSYMNATHVLKVAGFDKPHRTRILEKEVQTGKHEKVQGGYGKYQGTWVPYERGVALAKQYKVSEILDPIIHFVQGNISPPPAPKYKTSTTSRPKKVRETPFGRKRTRPTKEEEEIERPVQKPVAEPLKRQKRQKEKKKPEPEPEPVKKLKVERVEPQKSPQVPEKDVYKEHDVQGKSYAQRLLAFFKSGHQGTPTLLLRPPLDLNVNVMIDNEGHNSLHWASAMANLKMVDCLIQNKADICRVNHIGHTALMHSVLFTSNFEKQTFDMLLTYLRPIVFHIDESDQTVFHHVAIVSKRKTHASKYYLKCLINSLRSNRSELISILNVQDCNGDTALNIVARLGNACLIKLLIDAGASTEIANQDGVAPRDLIQDHPQQDAGEPLELYPFRSLPPTCDTLLRKKLNTIFRQITKSVSDSSVIPPIAKLFDSFAKSYERDLILKDAALEKKKSELEICTQRLKDSKLILQSVQSRSLEAYKQVKKSNALLAARYTKWLKFSQKHALQTHLLAPSDFTPRSDYHSLRTQILALQSSRLDKVSQIISLVCKSRPKRYQDYKRLISTSCNIAYDDVDSMLLPLIASFEQANLNEKVQFSFF